MLRGPTPYRSVGRSEDGRREPRRHLKFGPDLDKGIGQRAIRVDKRFHVSASWACNTRLQSGFTVDAVISG
jgi:hypothetical protein